MKTGTEAYVLGAAAVARKGSPVRDTEKIRIVVRKRREGKQGREGELEVMLVMEALQRETQFPV